MQLNYKEFGVGPPLIILHGLFGSLDNWQSIAKKLAENYTVILPDLRNHGKSPHFNEHSYPLMAEDLREFLENKWIHRCHLVGHSMGGKAAMVFALEYPDMVEKLVIVDIGTGKNRPGHEDIFDAIMSIDPAKMESRNEAESLLSVKIKDSSVILFLLKNLNRKKTGGYEWKMNVDALWQNYDQILAAVDIPAKFDGPALFMAGENSNYVMPEDMDEIRLHFPSAELKKISGAGHWVHADAPDAFIEILIEFLESTES